LGVGIASMISLQAVVIAMFLSYVLRLGLLWSGIRKVIGVELRDYLQVVAQSGFPALASSTAAWLIFRSVHHYVTQDSFVILASAGFGSALAWMLVVFGIRHPLAEEAKALLQKRLMAPTH
jgi:hypothetical protein